MCSRPPWTPLPPCQWSVLIHINQSDVNNHFVDRCSGYTAGACMHRYPPRITRRSAFIFGSELSSNKTDMEVYNGTNYAREQ